MTRLPLESRVAFITGTLCLLFAIGIGVGGRSATGEVAGVVNRTGISGDVQAWAYTATESGSPLPTGAPLARVAVERDGRFQIAGLPRDQFLWVAAILDRNESGNLDQGDEFSVARQPVSLDSGSVDGVRLHLREYDDSVSFIRSWEMTVSSSPWFRRSPGATSTASVDESLPLREDFGATRYSRQQVFDFAALPMAILLGLGFMALGAALYRHRKATAHGWDALAPGTGGATIESKVPFSAGWTLWLCLVLGFVVRAFGLGNESFELNETTYLLSALAPGGLVEVLFDSGGVGQWHSPFWRIFLRFCVLPFGDAQWWVRAPSVITGIVAVGATYGLGIRLLGRGAATAAGLAVALSPVAIFYSQDVSPYALLCALGPLSLMALLRAWTGKRLRDFVLYGVILGIAPAVHYYGGHLILSQALLVGVLVLRQSKLAPGAARQRASAACVSFVIAGLFCIPVAIMVKLGTGQALEASLAYQKSVGTYFEEPRYISDLFYLLRTSLGVTELGGPWGAIFAATIIAAGSWVTRRTAPATSFLFLVLPLAYMAIAEVLMGLTLQQAVYDGHYVAVRYWIHFLPVVALLAWGGIGTILSSRGSGDSPGPGLRSAACVAGLLLGAAALWGTWAQAARHDKTDLRAAADHILQGIRDDDAIVVTPACFFAIPFELYLADEPLQDNEALDQQPAWRSVRTPSGTANVFATATDFRRRYRSTVESRFVRDLWVVDVRPILFGEPEFSFVRSDSAVNDLLGAFSARTSTTLPGGVIVHHLSGDRARAEPKSGFRVGSNDDAFIRGFHPPPPQPAAARALGQGAEIRLPAPGPGAHRLSIETTSLPGAVPDSVEVHINGIAAGTATFDAEWNRSIFEFDTRANDENIVIEFGVSSAHNSMPRGALVREIVVDGNRWGEERAARRPIDSLSPELLVRSMLLFLRQTSGETLDSKSLVSVAELAEIAREDDFEGSQFRSAWNRLNRELETAGHEALPVPMNDGMGHLVRPSPLHALDEINWGEKRGPESR